MDTPEQMQLRTRMIARAVGPFFTIVPATVAVRASHMRTLLSAFQANPIWAWVLGAALLMGGCVIIAFHQYWRGLAAIFVSALGWFLAVRGVLLLVVPQTYDAAADSLTSPVAVGWIAQRRHRRPPAGD